MFFKLKELHFIMFFGMKTKLFVGPPNAPAHFNPKKN